MSPVLIAADLVAIGILIFGLFVPRHGRRDLVVAYLGLNIGVLAVTMVLASETVAAGLGLGLFGVLSIIRLRSEELSQKEIAYYFAALALGLIAGLGASNLAVTLTLMGLVIVAIGIGGVFSPRTERQEFVLDQAHPDIASARAHVERRLGVDVTDVTIVKTDLVNDTTLVQVRYRPRTQAAGGVTGVAANKPATAFEAQR